MEMEKNKYILYLKKFTPGSPTCTGIIFLFCPDTYYYKKKLSMKIVDLVNNGLFEHFLINKTKS